MSNEDNTGINAGDLDESVSNNSELGLLEAWQTMIEKPLTVAITPWEAVVKDSAQGSATSSELFEGRMNSDNSAWMDADLFTGGVADLLSSEADSLQAEAVLIGFEPVSIAEKSVLIGKGEGSGTGITVRVRFDRVSECILTGTKTVEQIWRTVGWVKPDRIPHDKKAVLFIRDIGNASRKIKARRKDDVERTTPEIDEQAREEYRQRVANA